MSETPDFEPHSLSKRFRDCLLAIRQFPGFERFLFGPSVNELRDLAEHGPLVIFNVSEIRSDAFLVERHGIRSLQLQKLTSKDLVAYSNCFLQAVHTVNLKGYSKARLEVKKVLEWLWDVAVNPILTVLGFTQTPAADEHWPRIWWVGSGLLNLLPIHAAGYHDESPSQAAIGCVISSYTSTIRALAFARERLTKEERSLNQRAMLVGMPETPNLGNLQFVAQEMEELQKLLKTNIPMTIVQNATRTKVLSMLNNHEIVHLSCHGSPSESDPSQSMLMLSDWQTKPLTVAHLASQNLQSSQFAYLSACHTASARNLSLLDESIHLAASIQLAGYPSVIGTLWEIRDEHSPLVAKHVYASMLKHGEGKYLEIANAAEALHQAVSFLREETRKTGFRRKGPSDPLIWASYIHMGV